MRGLSYTVESRQVADAGPRQHFAVSACATPGCNTKFEHYLGHNNNPERVQKIARRDGWTFDSWKKGHNICPACSAPKPKKLKCETGKKAPPVAEVSLAAMPQEVPVTQAITIDPPFSQEPTLTAMTLNGADHGTARPLTSDERFAVRNLLDRYFDDRAGRYLDGYSDQRVGQETKTPRASVTALREAAYGPLKSNDDLDAAKLTLLNLENKVAAAKRMLEAAKAGADAAKDVADKALARVEEADAAIKAISDSVDGMRRQINGIAAKLGIAA